MKMIKNLLVFLKSEKNPVYLRIIIPLLVAIIAGCFLQILSFEFTGNVDVNLNISNENVNIPETIAEISNFHKKDDILKICLLKMGTNNDLQYIKKYLSRLNDKIYIISRDSRIIKDKYISKTIEKANKEFNIVVNRYLDLILEIEKEFYKINKIYGFEEYKSIEDFLHTMSSTTNKSTQEKLHKAFNAYKMSITNNKYMFSARSKMRHALLEAITIEGIHVDIDNILKIAFNRNIFNIVVKYKNMNTNDALNNISLLLEDDTFKRKLQLVLDE